MKEVEVIYEEFPMFIDRKPWLAIYKYCTDEEFSFMYLNFFFPKGERIWKNFEEIIHVTETDEIEDTSEAEIEDTPKPKRRKRNNV